MEYGKSPPRCPTCGLDFRANAEVRAALQALVDALAANDEDGMTEFADVIMVRARAALK
tara:strand:- start:156 stop:332 length:177 start_codon:yes stop_codon:yes gene_type:complete